MNPGFHSCFRQNVCQKYFLESYILKMYRNNSIYNIGKFLFGLYWLSNVCAFTNKMHCLPIPMFITPIWVKKRIVNKSDGKYSIEDKRYHPKQVYSKIPSTKKTCFSVALRSYKTLIPSRNICWIFNDWISHRWSDLSWIWNMRSLNVPRLFLFWSLTSW